MDWFFIDQAFSDSYPDERIREQLLFSIFPLFASSWATVTAPRSWAAPIQVLTRPTLAKISWDWACLGWYGDELWHGSIKLTNYTPTWPLSLACYLFLFQMLKRFKCWCLVICLQQTFSCIYRFSTRCCSSGICSNLRTNVEKNKQNTVSWHHPTLS